MAQEKVDKQVMHTHYKINVFNFWFVLGYDPDNYENLIKRKYWEVVREKDLEEKERELQAFRKKRKRVIMSTIGAFNDVLKK